MLWRPVRARTLSHVDLTGTGIGLALERLISVRTGVVVRHVAQVMLFVHWKVDNHFARHLGGSIDRAMKRLVLA